MGGHVPFHHPVLGAPVSLIRPGLYGTPASIMPLAALFPIFFRAAFVLPRPREGGFLMYTRRLRARHLLHKNITPDDMGIASPAPLVHRDGAVQTSRRRELPLYGVLGSPPSASDC